MPHLTRCLAAIAFIFMTVPFAEAAEDPPSLETLISRLGDNNFRIRQAAGKALEERGEEALPALREAVQNTTDEEIRRRVEVLTQKIERVVLLSPKRVTLVMKDRQVQDVIKELARQTGYKFQYQGGGNRTMSISMENVTCWQALERICNDAGLTPSFDDFQGLVYFYQQDTISPYTYHTGPFRFVATNFNYSRYLNLANIPRNGRDQNNQFDNNLNFGFMIQAEPKAPLLSVSQPKLSKAIDENGLSLLPRNYGNDGQSMVQYFDGNNLYRNFQHSANVQMAKPAKDATRAKLIKGTVVVTVLSGTKPDVVFEKLTVGKKKLSGTGTTATIDIEEITEQNKSYQINMQIRKIVKNGEPPDYNWINTVQQKLELVDDKGQKYQSQGAINFIGNAANSVHAVYQFNPPPNVKIGKPTKLVLNQWLSLAHQLEFEFKDLPLP